MSKSELTYELEAEINKVNQVIDRKIVRGLSYTREAKYHKNLLNRLSGMRKKGFFARSMKFVGAFMF